MRQSLTKWLLPVLGLLICATFLRAEDAFDTLARDFWQWRTIHQPLSGDDIPRIEHPEDWVPIWSPSSIAEQRKALAEFDHRWKGLDASSWPAPRQVDYRLIGSALARVHWELDILRPWQRNPAFYIDQTLGAVFDRLVQPPPFDSIRSKQLVRRMANIPTVLDDARLNLTEAVGPFAQIAIAGLQKVRDRLNRVDKELTPLLVAESREPFHTATLRAADALEAYSQWIQQRLPEMVKQTAVGRENYLFFLKNVALIPISPEDMLQMGRQEWERAVAFETYEKNRNRRLPPLSIFKDQEAQIAHSRQDEFDIRRFLEEKEILTVPDWLQHYGNLPMPPYLEPLRGLGVTDDLTSPTRLKENAVSYIPVPSNSLGYFYLATAYDPRPLMVHEGIPGHYMQMALSWAHENPIRRHYYDSGSNEGIGFYAEEMMLQAGLFDNSPKTREIIYSFMRLRALRVEVDVKLATGQFSIQQAAGYLEKTVPMDAETALEEAASFASTPGHAITYQIGKLQILQFLADARRAKGQAFSLCIFHDFLYKNGNVPIALQRWEYLDDRPLF